MSERIAYEELKPGDVIQEGDEWQNNAGRWHPLVLTPGASVQVRDSLRARRPYKISTILEIGDALADAQKAATQLQNERDEAQAALKSAQRARDELQRQVDELREQQSPVTPADQLSFYELTEKRIASLEDDLSQVRADRDKLQGLIDDLLDEPTARQVQDMLRTWATELDWSAGCFGSFGRSQIDIIQQTMIAVIQRIGSMIDPEADSADA